MEESRAGVRTDCVCSLAHGREPYPPSPGGASAAPSPRRPAPPSSRCDSQPSLLEQAPPQAFQRRVDLGLADDQRRQQSHRRRSGGVQDQSLLEQRPTHHLGRGDVQLACEHKAAPAHGHYVRQALQAGVQAMAELAHASQ